MFAEKKWKLINSSSTGEIEAAYLYSMRANERAQELFTLGRSGARTPLSMASSPASMPIDQELRPSACETAATRARVSSWLETGTSCCLPREMCASLGSSGAFSLLGRRSLARCPAPCLLAGSSLRWCAGGGRLRDSSQLIIKGARSNSRRRRRSHLGWTRERLVSSCWRGTDGYRCRWRG